MSIAPEISFILPIFNAAHTLRDAVESVLSQQVSKEIILVDDGSSDQSLAIALEYARQFPFVSVIYGANRGVSAARNRGLALARGNFVLFLDPDDRLDNPFALANACADAHRLGANVVRGQFISYDIHTPEQVLARSSTLPNVAEDRGALVALDDFFLHALNRAWFIQIGCFLFQRQFLQQHNLRFDEQLCVGEDGLFLIDLYCQTGKILEVPSRFLHYRLNSQSVMMQAISEKYLRSAARNVARIEAKLAHCTTPKLRTLLNGALQLYSFFLVRDFNKIQSPELKAQFQSLITPELLARTQGVGAYSLV